MRLNELRDNQGARKNRTRIGRGIGSGKGGHTVGKGQKGQKSRSGVSINGFEGGQTNMFRRLAKRGFSPINRTRYAVVNLTVLQDFVDRKKIKDGAKLDAKALKEAGIINKLENGGVKILAKGELKAKLTLEVQKASEAAVKAVEKAGGKITIVELPKAKTEKEEAKK
ncbi:MAG: 50S ribosomal protein L15 [Alphaproteobacteria bacterium]|jgi:large subunit ribosomal protein L15|nr:50S ribosomal protein L15 [Alphaproteobacteria bacterium]MCV6599515.1 50S ribosomal protein L15 [Alphaproteobacteria bacterium]